MREWTTLQNGSEKLFGLYHFPKTTHPAPAVLCCHGFASSKVGTNRAYVQLAQALADNGVAVLRFDFRGSGDSEGDLSQMGLSDLVSDGKLALETLRSHPRVDATRVGILGSSLGGSIASLIADASIRALALWAPVASGRLWIEEWFARMPAQDTPMVYRGVVPHTTFRQEFSEMQAAAALGAVAPILHLHGEQDAVVSLSHQKEYRQLCRHPHNRFVTLLETDHTFGHSKEFPHILDQTVTWFKQHL